ncbi:cupin domain-containing protein [Peribacillus butanolivorans]|uniref:cupin domain-containing protein n=1 Tax=Peribacillus butanolivorans TaxID=421767 RepID=UPI003693AEE5
MKKGKQQRCTKGPSLQCFKGNETIHVIKREAERVTPEGKTIKLHQGDILSFKDGFEAHWKTLNPFTKIVVKN